MLCRLVPFDVKNCLVVDAILFSNLHECEFASESYLANCIFYNTAVQISRKLIANISRVRAKFAV
jgi:hypothetical protein